jgi:non-heme chloroperoxidase
MALVEAEDGVRLSCRQEGDPHDPPVLLIPDWLSSSRLYDDMVPELHEERLNALLYDPRGTGRSDRPDRGYGLRREAQDALLVADRFTADPVWVAGHGYGTLVALALAATAPERVRGLTLIAPVPLTGLNPGQSRLRALERVIEDWRGLADLVASTSATRIDPERLRQVAEDMAHTTRAAGLAQLERMVAPSLTPEVGRLSCPVVVVAGEYDEWISRERLRLGLLAYLVNARLEVVEACGHYLALEAPASTAAHVGDHLRFPGGRPALLLEEPELTRPRQDDFPIDGPEAADEDTDEPPADEPAGAD